MRPSVRLTPLYLKKKQRALVLRRQGYSYQEIAQSLRISKSTSYYWARKVLLTKVAQTKIDKKQKEALRKGLLAYNAVYAKLRSQKAAAIREEYKKKAAKEIRTLSRKDIRILGSALYWAEGGSKNRYSLRFANSNPMIINATMRFFREILNIPDEKIKARIHLYPDTDQKKAIDYWKKVTGLSRGNFHKPQVQISRASKRKRPRNTLPHGTLHLTVNSTELVCRVRGWIQGISDNLMRV